LTVGMGFMSSFYECHIIGVDRACHHRKLSLLLLFE
jgi:hypothetical protein